MRFRGLFKMRFGGLFECDSEGYLDVIQSVS